MVGKQELARSVGDTLRRDNAHLVSLEADAKTRDYLLDRRA
jgi:hypothetical protein